MAPVHLEFLGLRFHGYEGHWAFLALLLGFYYQRARSEAAGYSRDWFVSAYSAAVAAGFIFARLFHFLFWDTAAFLNDPSLLIRPGGGFAILGGTVGTALGGWIYCRRTGVNFLHWCDSLMAPICLCLGLGRLACFLNGDAYGLPSALPWAVSFSERSGDWMSQWIALHPLYATSQEPLVALSHMFGNYVQLKDVPLPAALPALRAEGMANLADLARYYPPNATLTGAELAQKGLNPFPVVVARVHPTQIYELLIMLAAYGLMIFAQTKTWARQRLFFLFWICYGANRFLIEIFRGDRNIAFASLTYAQLISLLLAAAGCICMFYLTKKWSRTGLPEPVLK